MKLKLEDLPEIISIEVAAKFFNCHRTTLWRWEKEIHDFPKSKKLSARKKFYLFNEVQKFVNSRSDSA